MLEHVTMSLKYAARSLARTPRFTVIAVFTVALAVGADTAIFSVVNGVLLRPLDYPRSEELVNVWSTAPGLGYDRFPLSPDVYFLYRSESTTFADMALYSRADVSVTGEGEPERVAALSATASLFTTLGVAPLLGRAFTEQEDLPGAPRVAVLSHELWQRRFGGDRSVLGRTISIEGEAREIVGVMPPRFDFPGDIQVWLPARLDPANPPAGQFSFPTVARLAPDVDLTQAEAQLAPLVDRLREQTDGDYTAFLQNGRYAPLVHSMKEDLVGSLQRPLWILLGTVGFVLLIACANVANLTLMRAEGRRGEAAVRTALGATHGALLRQSAVESLLVAAAGGALGLLVAWLAVPAVLRHAPPQLPRLDEVGVDRIVLLFTMGVTALAALLFGVAPLLRRSPEALLASLKQGGRGGVSSGGRLRARNLLVVAQTALALVLLVGSGLLVRSFQEARASELGFRYEGLLTFRLSLPQGSYPDGNEVLAFHEQLLERLRGLPGVESASMASSLPLAQPAPGTAFEIEERPTASGQLPPMLRYKFVSPGLVETLGVPVLEGRSLSASDVGDGAGHVLVDEEVAARFWPGGSAVGKRLRPSGDTTRWYAVEGVVARVRERGIRNDSDPLLYFPLLQPQGLGGVVRTASYVIRTNTPTALAGAVRSAVWEVDPDVPVADVRSGEDLVTQTLVQMSFTMATLGIAAVLALLLGAVGLYGVLAYSVAQRTREIGVRMALGAERGVVARMVMRDGARITALGLLVGLAGAAALTRVLQEVLFGVEPLDPATFGVTTALLMAVAVLATWVPARRAAGVDPMESLRAD